MPILSRLASALGRNDEEPNIALAKDVAAKGDRAAVRELVAGLSGKAEVASDCIKVLYEIGAMKPALIQEYVPDFVKLLSSKNNRLVWGAMTALGSVAPLVAGDIAKHTDILVQATEKGSVITQDWGVRVLAVVASQGKAHEAKVFPFLVKFLATCPAKDVPRHAESVLVAVNPGNRKSVADVLTKRLPEMKPPQAKRVEKTLKTLRG